MEQKEAQDNALTQQAANDFDEHMAAFQIDLFNSRKGYAAKDIYKAMKDESYKYFNNLTGEPKDDGKIRIASPDAKAKLQQYIDKRQSAFIAQSASYEANEIQSAQKATFEAALVNASNRMITAKTDQEMADAMAEIERINSVQLRGYPADYVKLETAKLQDAAAAGYITQKIAVDPLEALRQMEVNPNVSDYLTTASQAKLKTAIQEAYRPREVGLAMNNDVSELTESVIKKVYNVQTDAEAKYIRDSIINEAKEKKAVQDQKAADSYAAMGSDLLNRALSAGNEEERFRAEVALAEFAPQIYQTYSDMNEQVAEMATAKRIIELNNIEVPVLPTTVESSIFGSNRIEAPSAVKDALSGKEIKPFQNIFAGIDKDRIDRFVKERNAYDLQLAALPAEQRQIVEKYFDNINSRFANRNERMDVYTKIANGERNVEALGLSRFDGETQYDMMRAMQGVIEWDSVNAELRQGGVDLNNELNNSQFIELKNNPAKQMVVKQYLVREMQKYKAQNNAWPNVDQRQRMINSAIAGSKTPADEINTELQNITTQGYFDRALLSSDKIYKTKDTTYEKRYDIISDAIDEALDNSSLTPDQKNLARKYREQIIQSAMSGSALPVLQDILGVH